MTVLEPADDKQIPLDTERRLRLLEMSFVRITVSFGYTLLVGFAMLTWAVLEGFPWLPMALWTLVYILLFPVMRWYLKQFRASLGAALPEGEPALQPCYRHWYRTVLVLAALHGGLVGSLTLINAGVPSFEFLLLLTVIIAIMQATNAAHQTPVLKIYYTYYSLAWGGTLLTMPIVFSERWPYLLGLGLIHAGSTALDAKRINRFFSRQVELEQRSALLAEKAGRAEQEAITALRQKNEFLATASHDLRQPLHALNLNVEALAQAVEEPRHHALIGDIQSCIKTLAIMFNSILDLSKLESGQSIIELRPLDLKALLADMSRVFAAEAKLRKLEFRLHLPKYPVIIESDENLLRQIVTNLLQNALRYTESGGVLLALRVQGMPRLEVIDTGIGIADADKPLIHQLFFRARVGFSDSINSHGLGLAVVDRCVTLLGAKHGFRSRPGHGSRFWVVFPASRAIASVLMPAPDTTEKLGNISDVLKGDRCLIIEDDPMVARGWRSFLTPTGMHIEVTADFTNTAGLLAGGYQPDYVLCDLRLRSGDNGYSVLQHVMSVCPGASCAMVSGEFDAPELAEAAEEGIPVLHKPVSPGELLRILLLWRSARQD
jgi:signal transduction histidine kinase/CheY-like chemotaxis protein